jgi:O-antigen ligase
VSSDAISRGKAALVAAAAAALIVSLIASLEIAWRHGFRRYEGHVAVALWTCVLAVGAGAFVVHYGRPDTWLSDRWHEFRNPQLAQISDAARFGTATSNRYDYWRVAAHTFEAHPLGGDGAGAFAVPWFRHRTIDESVTDAHSWEAGSLAETGLVGFLLLGAALILPLVRVARVRNELGGFTAVALGGTAAFFVLHGSFEWLFLIPSVAVPAAVALGACAAAGDAPEIRLAPGRQRTAVAVGALLAAVAAVPVYLATTLTARAEAQSATSTRRALDTLSLAQRVNPWAVEPLIVRSTILESSGDYAGASKAAGDATRRASSSWIAWLALAEAQRRAGHATAARAALRQATRLNPRAPQAEKGPQ